jgi:hypothetical protein
MLHNRLVFVGLATGLGMALVLAKPPLLHTLRDCESCVAVDGMGWCPIARQCSPGYPGKAGSCRGDASDHARAAATAADDRLLELLRNAERGHAVAVLYFHTHDDSDSNNSSSSSTDGEELGGGDTDATPALVEAWESTAQVLGAERDVRFYTLDCTVHTTSCSTLLPSTEVVAAQAAGLAGVPVFYAAGTDAGSWGCPREELACDHAFPRGRRIWQAAAADDVAAASVAVDAAGATASDESDGAAATASSTSVSTSGSTMMTVEALVEAVSAQLSAERGFPLPELAELAADFVRAVMLLPTAIAATATTTTNNNNHHNKELEAALLAKARAMANAEALTPRQRAAAENFVAVMQQLLMQPAGRGGHRVSLLARLANQAASAAKGDHASLEDYVQAQARHYALKTMTAPLFG